MHPDNQPPQLVEHFFRHEYGRLVSRLAGRFGTSRLTQVEDCVQSALAAALATWTKSGVPDNPAGWLHRVARNALIDQIRRESRSNRSMTETACDLPEGGESPPLAANSGSGAESVSFVPDGVHLPHEIIDPELRMLFVCCDPQLPERTQLIFALKILCGFSVKEISLRLLSNEEAVGKRLRRGRTQLRDVAPELDSPDVDQLRRRLPAVHRVLYLLFNEGYSSAIPDQPIRKEMCTEAIRLAQFLIRHPALHDPQSWALLALMHFHHARLDGRVDGAGALLLLEEQDRSRWDREQIRIAYQCLGRSASGEIFSRYHAEAGVLAEHCFAPSYDATRWSEIVDLYLMLEKTTGSPLHTLNRAIAIAEWKGPAEGLAVLRALSPPSWLLGYYLWDATLGELHRRAGETDKARQYLKRALEAAPTDSEKQRIRRRLECAAAPSQPNQSRGPGG